MTVVASELVVRAKARGGRKKIGESFDSIFLGAATVLESERTMQI